MLFLQYYFIPELFIKTLDQLKGTQITIPGYSAGGGAAGQELIDKIGNAFLILVLVQSLFTGLVVGKLSEGNIKSGIKHSAILIAAAYLIITGARAFV